MHGFKLEDTDIKNSYPLGSQARGQGSLPIVITYKDKEIAESFKRAALWDQRKKQTNTLIKTKEKSRIKKTTSWFKKALKGNKNEEITKRKGFSQAPQTL